MRKKNRLLALLIPVCLIIVLIMLLCTQQYWMPLPYDPHNLETYCDAGNTVSPSAIEKLHEGMSYSQVIRKIGKATRQSGSGFFILEYDCTDGSVLSLYIDNSGSGRDPCYVEGIIIQKGQ